MGKPLISVIIAHNALSEDRRTRLSECINSIIDDWGQEFVDLRVVSDGNKSQARNMGALHSRSEILVFFDDDVVVRKGCIQELLEPFKDPKVGIVGGVNIPFQNVSLQEQIGASLMSSPLTMFRSCARYTPRGDVRESDEAEILSAVMAVRKTAFIAAGGFPEDIIPCEETVLINFVQARGYKVIYNPFAVVYHRRPKVFKQYFMTVFNYGRGRGVMLRRLRAEGTPKMLWTPNRRWLYYVVGFICHYIAYTSGVVWGLLSGKHEDKKHDLS